MDRTSTVANAQQESDAITEEVLAGLRQDTKQLPSKFFYDQRGSQLFDQICELDEYYLTRTELQIMQENAEEIAQSIGPRAILIEYGSGSSVKTRILLDHLVDPVAYVPVDISAEHLQATATGLLQRYPDIPVHPVCADFTEPFDLPDIARQQRRRAVYLPGSTIGNFANPLARRMLKRIADVCGPGGCLVIGIDLQKDVSTIEQAYNDSEGVTAEFNLNMLRHVNRAAAADFELGNFAHEATYDRQHHRMEISLVSLCDQTVTVGDEEIELAEGEAIRTELCHKYTIDGFSRLAEEGSFQLKQAWTDEQKAFAVLHYEVSAGLTSR